MNVLLLTSDAYGCNGGIGLYNRDIIEAILAHDAAATITVIPRSIEHFGFTLPDRCRLETLGSRSRAGFVAAAAREAALRRYDFVICGHIHLLSIARLLAMRNGCPLALMVYGIDVWEPIPGRQRDVRHCDAIWSISRITSDRMNDWAGLPRATYVQLPNAIHLENYAMGPKPDDLAALWNVVGKRVAMTLARLPGRDRHKGVDEMIEAMPALVRQHPDLVYIVAGDGADRARLEQKAADIGMTPHVRFTGFIDEARKADYFRLADVFVMPGRGEGFGFVFLEALACGIPCVGSSVDGSREALRDGTLGLLVDPDDPAAIVAAVSRALAMPREIPEGLAYFSWEEFVARVGRAVAKFTRTGRT